MSAEDLRSALLEIIDSLKLELEGDGEGAVRAMKQSIERFRRGYLDGFVLDGGSVRVRVKARMLTAYICSTLDKFPQSEALWRFLYDHITLKGNAYLFSHPDDQSRINDLERLCTEETRLAMELHPIEHCLDVAMVKMRFETMRHLAHGLWIQPDGSVKPEREPDAENKSWIDVTPWTIEKTGKSMLVDYWWRVPDELRPFGNRVLNELASSNIRGIDDLRRLRREVEEWNP